VERISPVSRGAGCPFAAAGKPIAAASATAQNLWRMLLFPFAW
jgi:hypothetical protein